MDKRYEPLIIEEKWSELWAKNNLGKNNSSQTFSTGTLHMGHSFQYSIMDFYARYNHLNDVNTHWQMGTDHAGIATQMVVVLKKFGSGKNFQKIKLLDKLKG